VKNKNGRIIIGLDLDNTIIDYGSLFYDIAVEKGWVPIHCHKDKMSVRTWMQKKERNNLWTELQGFVYGPHLKQAVPYHGVAEFLEQCRDLEIPVWVISHKTRFPAIGYQYDLHASASAWLSASGLIYDADGGVSGERVFFCETRSEKIAVIRKLDFTHFVDDLPEVFIEADFPENTQKYLFDPEGTSQAPLFCQTVHSWKEIQANIFKE
jgi:hypothetical protein